MRFILILFSLCFTFQSPLVLSQTIVESKGGDDQEWVIVFDDPRPARLRGWQTSSYSKQNSYRNSLALKRFGKKMASKHGMELRDQWFIASLGVYCLVVRFNGDDQKMIKLLEENELVQWVQPSNEFKLLSNKIVGFDDSLKRSLAPAFLTSGVNGSGVTIAIIDSAVDAGHQDFSNAINKRNDFVVPASNVNGGEAHGTAIASVMITQPNTKFGVAGVAPSATIEAYRGCWETPDASASITHCNTLSLARALDAVASSRVDILNLSLSGPNDALLERLLSRIIAQKVVVVAAFDPLRPKSETRFPSSKEGVIIVRAEGLHKSYSDVFTAPGSRVVASPNNGYDFMTGHSVAAAYTSAVIALCKQAKVSINPKVKLDCGWKNVSSFRGTKDFVYSFFSTRNGANQSWQKEQIVLTHHYKH